MENCLALHQRWAAEAVYEVAEFPWIREQARYVFPGELLPSLHEAGEVLDVAITLRETGAIIRNTTAERVDQLCTQPRSTVSHC